jgi:nicotinamide-nucleotide amidase
MAEGALERSSTDLGVAVTGIAGPGGATPAKPVGLVHIAAARRGCDTVNERHVFSGDRAAVRLQAVEAALVLLLRQATASGP